MPGYCVAGTVGHKILNGARKIEMENKQVVSLSHKQCYCFTCHITEPPRDKTNKVSVRPAKTQISLGIRPV